MQKLIWQNSKGEEINLTSGHYGITNWQGFSEVSLNVQSQTVPFQDGSVYLDALPDERELSVTLAIQDNNDLELRYQLRRELIHALNPKFGEGYLIYTNDFISKRIKCVANVPVFENHNSNDTGTPKASLTWTACNPYWEDLEETVVNLKINEVKTLNNEGDIPAQMEIDLFTDNAVNPSIERLSDGNKIKYNGTLNKNLYINTNIGEKKVFSEDLEFNISEYNGIIKGVCYSSELGLFVGVSSGVIYTSYDGQKWRKQSIEFIELLYDVIYVNNIFLAVGENGLILTSNNGFDWIKRISGVNFNLKKVCYGNNIFVVAGDSGTVLLSNDGIEWVSQASGYHSSLVGLSFCNNKFMATGGSSIIISTDGINWTIYDNAINTDDFSKIIYVSELNLYIGAGHTNIETSTDGINWVVRSSSLILTGEYTDLLYKDNTIYVISTCGVNFYGIIATSTDGINWVVRENYFEELPQYSSFYSIVYSQELQLLLIVGDNGVIITSINGEDWESIGNKLSKELYSIAYSQELKLYVSVGYNSIATSTDGINWIMIDNEEVLGNIFYGVTYGKGKFVAVGYNVIYYSENGIDWNEIDYDEHFINDIFEDIIFHNGLFVAVGRDIVIETSTDGINWVSHIVEGYSITYKNIIYADNKYISNGGKWISTDGINWEYQSNNNTNGFIAYSQELKLYVSVGYNSIATSTDGINWVSQNRTEYLDFICYSEEYNKFIAVGKYGEILISSDGYTWKKIKVVKERLNEIKYFNHQKCYYIVGYNGTILYSSDSQEENQIQNIDANSDMNLNIPVGENKFRVIRSAGNVNARIIYRQKYIGV